VGVDRKRYPSAIGYGGRAAHFELEYYEGGYPKLPACVDRRKLPISEAALDKGKKRGIRSGGTMGRIGGITLQTIYVSNHGNDAADGLTRETAVHSWARCKALCKGDQEVMLLEGDATLLRLLTELNGEPKRGHGIARPSSKG
jgi:hypothetical protein